METFYFSDVMPPRRGSYRMLRIARAAAGRVCYQVINRGNGRMKVFCGDEDYAAVVELLVWAYEHASISLASACYGRLRVDAAFNIRKCCLRFTSGRGAGRYADGKLLWSSHACSMV